MKNKKFKNKKRRYFNTHYIIIAELLEPSERRTIDSYDEVLYLQNQSKHYDPVISVPVCFYLYSWMFDIIVCFFRTANIMTWKEWWPILETPRIAVRILLTQLYFLCFSHFISGHYTTLLRVMKNDGRRVWVKCNDSTVTSVSDTEAMKECASGYIFFYEQSSEKDGLVFFSLIVL